jgi:hypothetical protein
MCNKVIRKHLGAVQVDVGKGEQLRHTVTVKQGSSGLFSLVDNATQAVILTGNEPPGPTGPQWSRLWPQPSDTVTGNTLHGLLLQFVAAKSYTWRIDRLSAQGTVIETPLDIDYTDDKPTDHCFGAINVLVTKGGVH